MSSEAVRAPTEPVHLGLTVGVDAILHHAPDGRLRAEIPALPDLVIEGEDLVVIEAKLLPAIEQWVATNCDRILDTTSSIDVAPAVRAAVVSLVKRWIEADTQAQRELMAEAAAITPRDEQLEEIMARGIKPTGWCESEEPLF
jgi:hypothetical protein